MIVKDTGKLVLVYSPDERVYYWQRTDTWEVSQVFKYEAAAVEAEQRGKLVWG